MIILLITYTQYTYLAKRSKLKQKVNILAENIVIFALFGNFRLTAVSNFGFGSVFENYWIFGFGSVNRFFG